MSLLCVNTTMCCCSFGMTPAPLTAATASTVIASNQIAATIMDLPKVPFGMCSSLANPTVASATAAALGVLTPMPCVPTVPAPWIPGCPTVLIGGYPALDNSCKAMCAFAGVISITMTPAVTVQVP